MKNRSESERVADLLQKYNLQNIATLLLELAGPFRYLAAQVMYVIEPFVGGQVNLAHDLAVVLEDEEKVEDMLVKLREGDEQNG